MKKTILIIHDYPHSEGGGIEVQCFLDARELVQKGYSVTIASTRHASETYSGKFVSKKDGVDFVVIKSSAELAKLIDRFHIIHIQATFSLRKGMMDALSILVKKKRKFIISIHTNYNHSYFSAQNQGISKERNKVLKEFVRCLASPYASIVGVSESLRESLKKIGVSKKFTVIHNAKDWKTFVPTRSAGKIPPADITYIGELSSMKGIHTLLGAIILLRKTMPKIMVRLIGNGTSEKECLSIIQGMNLEKNIASVGHVENKKIPDYLVRTKLLVLPSLTEAWGNIVMEAMGLEVPTVSSGVEGLIELTENGTRGFLCAPGDASDLAEKCLGVLKGTLSLPCNLKETARHTQESFSIEKRIRALEAMYLSV